MFAGSMHVAQAVLAEAQVSQVCWVAEELAHAVTKSPTAAMLHADWWVTEVYAGGVASDAAGVQVVLLPLELPLLPPELLPLLEPLLPPEPPLLPELPPLLPELPPLPPELPLPPPLPESGPLKPLVDAVLEQPTPYKANGNATAPNTLIKRIAFTASSSCGARRVLRERHIALPAAIQGRQCDERLFLRVAERHRVEMARAIQLARSSTATLEDAARLRSASRLDAHAVTTRPPPARACVSSRVSAIARATPGIVDGRSPPAPEQVARSRLSSNSSGARPSACPSTARGAS
jgi:hypothetical protein